MSEQTKIQWCDSTINFWSGCTKVSAGCANCYAEEFANRFPTFGKWGKGTPRQWHANAVKVALKLNRKPWVCNECGSDAIAYWRKDEQTPEALVCLDCDRYLSDARFINNVHRRRIFSLSIGDWLDEEVPIEWLAEMLDTIRQCSDVQWILCSKRLENFTARMERVYSHPQTLPPLMDFIGGWIGRHTGPLAKGIPKNILLLASVENQEQADIRIPQLLKIPAAKRGLSMEPLLGLVDLSSHLLRASPQCDQFSDHPKLGKQLHWVIIGGESGPSARPCNVHWIRAIGNQCRIYNMPVFVKQLGAFSIEEQGSQRKRILFDDKKGGNPAEWPEDLRVQEWPD